MKEYVNVFKHTRKYHLLHLLTSYPDTFLCKVFSMWTLRNLWSSLQRCTGQHSSASVLSIPHQSQTLLQKSFRVNRGKRQADTQAGQKFHRILYFLATCRYYMGFHRYISLSHGKTTGRSKKRASGTTLGIAREETYLKERGEVISSRKNVLGRG